MLFHFQCLVDENEKIRRDVCGCSSLDPSQPRVSTVHSWHSNTAVVGCFCCAAHDPAHLLVGRLFPHLKNASMLPLLVQLAVRMESRR